MTTHELEEEMEYRIEERLGILCGSAEPTPEQLKIANDEAEAWAKKNHSILFSAITKKP